MVIISLMVDVPWCYMRRKIKSAEVAFSYYSYVQISDAKLMVVKARDFTGLQRDFNCPPYKGS